MADISGQAVQARDVRGGIHLHGGGALHFPVPRQLPGDIPDFINRADEIHRLDELLNEYGAGNFVVTGTAGVGKTTLVAHWAHRIKERFSNGQLYANLRGYDPRAPVAPEQIASRFLRALGTTAGAIPLDLDERTDLYRSLLAAGRFLVVLDNAASVGQVRPLLVGAPECAVVVTSRDRLSGLVTRDGAHRIALGTLSPAQSVALLQKITVGPRAEDRTSDLALLARLCARLPLALKIAAERAVTRPHSPLSELILELQDKSGPWEVLAMDDEQDTVRSVFAWSYRVLPEGAARLFRVLGVFPGAEFCVQAAAAAADIPVKDAKRLLDVLTGAHLLEQTGVERFEYHDLLRAYAAELAQRHDTETGRADTARRLLLWYLRTAHAAASLIDSQFPDPSWPSLDGGPVRTFSEYEDAVRWYEAERGNLAAAVKMAATDGFHEIAWQLPLILRRIYTSRAPVDEWISTANIGLEAARAHGPGSAVADLLESLGMAYVQSRQTDAGRRHHLEALEIRATSADIFGQGSSFNSLGLVDLREHRFADARSNFERALGRFQVIGDEQWQGISLGNLADALLEDGALEEAELAANHAVDFHRRTGNRLSEFSVIITLSRIAHVRGNVGAAVSYVRGALELAGELENDIRIAYASMELGRLYSDQGEIDDALRAYHDSAGVHRKIGDVVREAEAIEGVAEVRQRQNAIDEAGDLYRRVLDTYRRVGAERKSAFAHLEYGKLLFRAGRYTEARIALNEARTLLSGFTDSEAVNKDESVSAWLREIRGMQ